jgi:hypothetical protein
VKTTTTTARQLLREGNPVPGDAFPDAARDPDGRAVLTAILAATPQAATPQAAGRPAIRNWKVVVPAGAMTAALAGLLAVMLSASGGSQPVVAGQPSGFVFASLIADRTVHPTADREDAAAVLRQLAAAAARQPAVPLGPVEYAQVKSWGLDLNRPLQYDLSYVSHETSTSWGWMAPDGSSMGYYTVPGGRYQPGTIPLQKGAPTALSRARFAWYDPARLPADIAALRRHLIAGAPTAFPGGTGAGSGSGAVMCDDKGCHPLPVPTADPAPDPVTNAIVSNALDLMTREPLPPAVRASLLRVLADSAAQGRANAHFIDMGTVTDRAGHAGVAIGYQAPDISGPPDTRSHLEVLVFDPATGALLGDEDAYCTNRAGSYPAAGSCTPEGYDQVLQVKAVQAIPAAPKLPPVPRWTPTTPGLTAAPQASPPAGPTPQLSAHAVSNP